MKWKSLILGGGGSTGEFQMGALKVVAEQYKSFDLYVGVGVGSLHSTVLAQYETVAEGYAVLQHIWDGFKRTKDVFNVPLLGTGIGVLSSLVSDKGWARDGALGNGKFRRFVEQTIDWNRLKDKENWAIQITSLSDGRLYTLSNHGWMLDQSRSNGQWLKLSLDPSDPCFIGAKIHDFITAAGSVPLMLPPVGIFGHRFVEGGLRDFTPLQIAVQAFARALAQGHPYTEAEFIVLDNYPNEVSFEAARLLDSGNEIVVRTIKIMTVEMAKNDIALGKNHLAQLPGVASNVTLVQPKIDYRLHPLNFNDHKTRQAMRNHGISQAALALGTERGNPEPSDKKAGVLNGEQQQGNTFYPKNLDELIAGMQEAKQQGKRIKAMGSGYAFSNILDTTGIRINLSRHLNGIWFPDREILNTPDTGYHLCEFETGATVDALNTFLWNTGKTLLNQPGFEKLNFFGTATAGGHGSGINLGPLASAIRSMHLLTFDPAGKVVQKRIEPTQGITDASKFKQRYPHIELVQDDKVFNACLVSVGCLGVVYSAIIGIQDRFFLEERRTLCLWSELKPRMPSILSDKTIHSIHIWFNPYVVKGKQHCVLSVYKPAEGPRRGRRGWGTTWNGVDEISPLLQWIMEKFPRLVPRILSTSLRATVNKKPPVLPNPEALNFGSPNHVKVKAADCGVDASRTVEVADSLFQLFQERYKDGLFVTSPIGFRFTAEGEAFLSPQYQRKTCMIELPFLQGTDGTLDSIREFHELLFEKFEGRPHWGQVNNVIDKAWFKKLFPAWKDFVSVYKEYNDGSFDGPLTEQLRLRELINEL